MKSDEAPKIAWLDTLRHLSALAVVVCHARAQNFVEFGLMDPAQKGPISALFFALTRLGREAVLIFFVLSGYLVLGKTIERLRAGSFDDKRYALDRLARIYTPLLPAIGLTILAQTLMGGHVSPWNLVGNILGIQGAFCQVLPPNDPLWSLSYEMWFYAITWGAFRIVAGKTDMLGVGILSAGLLIFTKLNPTFLFCWLLGGLAYFYRPTFTRTRLAIGTGLTCVGFALIELSSASRSLEGSRRTYADLLPDSNLSTILAALACCHLLTVLTAHRPTKPLARMDESLGRGARSSYTLYLTHMPILCILGEILPGKFTTFSAISMGWLIVRVLLCMGAAALLWTLFERHTATVKKWMEASILH